MAAANGALDVGVHLTLTSEKRPYRWRPLTTLSRSAGLTDELGFFWPDVASVRRNAVPEALEIELRAQIDTALAVGVDVTHLDAHMGAVNIRNSWISTFAEAALTKFRFSWLRTWYAATQLNTLNHSRHTATTPSLPRRERTDFRSSKFF